MAKNSKLPPYTAGEITAILRRYAPKLEHYQEWMRCASGLCAEYGETEAESIMLSVYGDHKKGETRKLIKGFKGKFRCTLGTVIRFAVEGGFDTKAYNAYRRKAFREKGGFAK